ncbi:hypothetical protein BJY16_005211 [Actinoplanes octamycinicus]|uniref:Uncharacterized protein n=1 Tax=Actinoplanes octamycinicus TaxID=135948 RepID=A0A7W7M9A8_9ACTN|nr:hypothetical protein [Actinoplanes octamycinicus]MBB4741752.1 hypothetical protein [Actinoplanes octamycinicus]
MDRLNNAYAWGMALTFPVQSLVPYDSWALYLPFVAVYVGFAVADSRAVRAAGYEGSFMLAFMFGIAYLWLRPRRTGQGYAIPMVATIGIVGAVVLRTA